MQKLKEGINIKKEDQRINRYPDIEVVGSQRVALSHTHLLEHL